MTLLILLNKSFAIVGFVISRRGHVNAFLLSNVKQRHNTYKKQKQKQTKVYI